MNLSAQDYFEDFIKVQKKIDALKESKLIITSEMKGSGILDSVIVLKSNNITYTKSRELESFLNDSVFLVVDHFLKEVHINQLDSLEQEYFKNQEIGFLSRIEKDSLSKIINKYKYNYLGKDEFENKKYELIHPLKNVDKSIVYISPNFLVSKIIHFYQNALSKTKYELTERFYFLDKTKQDEKHLKLSNFINLENFEISSHYKTYQLVIN